MVKVVEKSWNEFWAAYWRIGDRHRIPGIFEWDRRLVEFIEDVCCLSPGARILDLGCGGGDQAKVFASKGYDVVGVDIAPSLVAHARDQFEHEGLNGTFLVGDMRRIDYDGEFDCCTILSGTFGFFGAEGGWELSETWFDQETSTYRSRVFLIMNDGRVIRPKPESGYHANESIRCYTVPEMRSMLSAAGLTYLASYSSGDFSSPPAGSQPERPRDIVVAERLGTGEESFSQ
jgi:SAM-dependent methyltransferase